MTDKHEDSEFPPRFSDGDTQRMIDGAYFTDEMKTKMTHVALKALGDLSPICETCGELCGEHCIKLRDAFFARASLLSAQLLQRLAVYRQTRQIGIPESPEIINSIYSVWSELNCLHEIVEPQLRAEDEDLLDEGEDQEG